MRKFALVVLALSVTSSFALAAERPMRFWNLTRHTISEFYLASSGTTNWGPNQCKNDKDGTVDPDERLLITGVTPGRYDVKIGYKRGRTCRVANVTVEAGKAGTLYLGVNDAVGSMTRLTGHLTVKLWEAL